MFYFFPLLFHWFLKLLLLERSLRCTSLFWTSLAQLGLVVWMTSMSFLRLNRFVSIVVIFSFNLLSFLSVSPWVNSRLSFRSTMSLLRWLIPWFTSLSFMKLIALCYFDDFWTFSPVFFVIASWCCLNISKIF